MCISLIWGKWGIWAGFRVGVAMAVLLLGPVPELYDQYITIMYMDMDMYLYSVILCTSIYARK